MAIYVKYLLPTSLCQIKVSEFLLHFFLSDLFLVHRQMLSPSAGAAGNSIRVEIKAGSDFK